MKKPFLHALGAAVYIVLIVSVVNVATLVFKRQEGTIFIPILMLSLFVLSAAVMGYFFLSEPVYLLMEHRKKEAMVFFGKVAGFFAGFVALFAILVLFSLYVLAK